MYEIYLNYSLQSIRNAFFERANQLFIFDLPFLFRDWEELEIKISSVNEKIKIDFEFINKNYSFSEVSHFLKNPIPEIFDIDYFELNCLDGNFKSSNFNFLNENTSLTDLKIEVSKISENSSKNFKFILTGYSSDRFNAEINIDILKNYFFENSIIGNSYNKKKRIIHLKHFANKLTITSLNNFKTYEKFSNYVSLNFDVVGFGSLKLGMWSENNPHDSKKNIVMFLNNQIVRYNKDHYYNELRKAVSSNINSNYPKIEKYISYNLEINYQSIIIDEKHNIVTNNDFNNTFKKICNTLSTEIKKIRNFDKLIFQAENLSLSLAAEKLNLRKDKYINSKKIIIDEEIICRVPINEQETVLLFLKLMSKGVSPINLFNIVEYSTSEGIDSLANVQISEQEPIHNLAVVEFEPNFSQFILHQHPFMHVDYIVCWEISEEWKKKLERIQDWLYIYDLNSNGKKIRIVEIKKFKCITIN